MLVRYLMSIFTLEKIIEPMYNIRPIFDVEYYTRKIVELMYYARPIFDVDYYTRENYRATVECSSNILCRFSH